MNASPESATTASPGAKPIPLRWALVPVVSLVFLLYVVIVQLEGSGHVPLITAAAIGAIVARVHGWRWIDVQRGITDTINMAMGAILILLVIGMLMGTWLASGIVPAFIDWGLALLAPSYFLPATCIVCSIISLVTGSSWSTAGTIGVALIAIGDAMGVDKAMTAGAVISGAYFGDKLSPMSDTTNLAPAMAGSDLITHIRHMVWTTGPALIISVIAFTVLGLSINPESTGTAVGEVRALIQDQFSPGIGHIVVPLLVIGLVAKKMPALPSLLLGAVLGGMLAIINGADLSSVLTVLKDGYVSKTGNAMVDDLLTRGGFASMADTVILILAAMSFGGVLERTGMLQMIASQLLKFTKSTGSLVMMTILTAIGVNVLAADQYVSVVVSGRMYGPEFRKRNLAPENLSRALEDGGTITSPLIPWNTCGAFMAKTLGVATGEYWVYCFLNIINPIIGIIYGFTGFTIRELKKNRETDS